MMAMVASGVVIVGLTSRIGNKAPVSGSGLG